MTKKKIEKIEDILNLKNLQCIMLSLCEGKKTDEELFQAICLDSKTQKKECLFNWEEIPKDCEKLKGFISSIYNEDWIKTAEITKTDDGKTINITEDNQSILLNLFKNENNITKLKICNNDKNNKKQETNFIAISNDGKTNIYEIKGGTYDGVLLLRKCGYVDNKDSNGAYELTPTGKLLASTFRVYCSSVENFDKTFEFINKNQSFWDNHFIGGLPEESLKSIGDLRDSRIETTGENSVNAPLQNYINHLEDAKKVFCVSSVENDSQRKTMIDLLEAGVPIEFVHTDTFNQKQYVDKNKKLKEYSNFKSMVIEEKAKMGLTVTDYFLSLGFYKKDKKNYDPSEDLFSENNKKAIDWGMRLFEHYKKKSKPDP